MNSPIRNDKRWELKPTSVAMEAEGWDSLNSAYPVSQLTVKHLHSVQKVPTWILSYRDFQ